MAIRHVAPLRFAPAFMALGVCEQIWPFSLRDIWATILSPKWTEIFVTQMAGDETSLPHRKPELVLGSTYQIFEWNRNNSDRNFDFWETNRTAADRIF